MFRYRPLLAYILLAPLLLWLLITIAIPVGYLMYLSFIKVGIAGTGGTFVWFDNYANVLDSKRFFQALQNTLFWIAGNGLVQVTLAFLVARLLYKVSRLNNFLQIWIILPWVIPGVAAVIIWRWMLSGIGIVNYALDGVTKEPISFFATPISAMLTTIFVNSWRFFPLLTVIVLAAMRTIPRELREAALVDGASENQTWRFVMLPLLRPVLYVMGLLGTLWSANIFDVIWLLTKGGPSGGTTTLPIYIYEEAFSRFKLGNASAASVLMSLALLLFVILFLRTGWGRDIGRRS